LGILISRNNHVEAHEHHSNSTSGISSDPIDGILWTHIVVMFTAFAILFPTGMVLGFSKSRWHVPIQIFGTILATIGYFLGHAHGGREFSENIHSSFATYVVFFLMSQIGIGVYLRLHWERGPNRWLRPISVKFHRVFGVCVPIIGYIQIVFGVITMNGWCRADGDHTGQCLAHTIMPWSHKDYQHTVLGIVWWVGGLVGIYLTRKGQRSVIPALIILFTGYVMSSHAQSSEISRSVHKNFGFALISASIARIIEVSFLKDKVITPFHHLCPYLLILSGLLFMGANEEQIDVLEDNNFDAYSYGLVHASIAFLIFLYVHLQIDLYWRSGENDGEPEYIEDSRNISHIPLSMSDPMTSSTISHDDDDMIQNKRGNNLMVVDVNDNSGNEDHVALLNNESIYHVFTGQYLDTIQSIFNKPIRKSHNLGTQVQLKNVFNLPLIQYDFSTVKETSEEKQIREKRRKSIKNGFLHSWRGYTKYAWGSDELLPISNGNANKFNGWGATIVDSLDTMWIMGLRNEFAEAREFVSKVNFSRSEEVVNVFETTIRYLGGLLSAYELSKDTMFLSKANDLGLALLTAFNSTTGLPYNYLSLSDEFKVVKLPWINGCLLAQVGSLYLEFSKLAELTGNSEFFFKVNNITKVLKNSKPEIPGLYPINIDQDSGEFWADVVTFGANGDSFYEYLIKEYILVGGALKDYRKMYIESINGMHRHLIKHNVVKSRPDLMFLGELTYEEFYPRMDHLSCFVPGMLAIGSKVLNRPRDFDVAIGLAETCYWSYKNTRTGIGPEVFCLFILYRITGNKEYQEKGWEIWQSIEKYCKTETAYSGLSDVNELTETLKYLYLLFSPPDLISLDTYVFNTEAHPFLRMIN
ncbi:414_t:CDS:10, partial [Diversispora eburnea]